MKKLTLIIIILFSGMLFMAGCAKNDDNLKGEDYPLLKIENLNESDDYITIYYIELVGYKFNNLSISKDESQTFSLDSGMQGGYTDIFVTIRYVWGATNRSQSMKVNFQKGNTTTIMLKREGYGGIYLESNP